MSERSFSIAATAIFMAGGIFMLIADRSWFPDFYTPSFMALMAFVAAAIIWVPELLYLRDRQERRAYRKFQAPLAASLLINASGALGLYKLYTVGFAFDKLAHFLIPMILTIGLARVWRVKIRHGRMGWYLRRIAATVFIAGIVWEGWEAFMDWVFNTKTFGIDGRHIPLDTMLDVVMNTMGIITGAVGYMLWHNKKVEHALRIFVKGK